MLSNEYSKNHIKVQAILKCIQQPLLSIYYVQGIVLGIKAAEMKKSLEQLQQCGKYYNEMLKHKERSERKDAHSLKASGRTLLN